MITYFRKKSSSFLAGHQNRQLHFIRESLGSFNRNSAIFLLALWLRRGCFDHFCSIEWRILWNFVELVLDRNAEIHLDYVDVRTKAGLFGRIRHVELFTGNIQDGRFQNLFPNDRKGMDKSIRIILMFFVFRQIINSGYSYFMFLRRFNWTNEITHSNLMKIEKYVFRRQSCYITQRFTILMTIALNLAR